MNKIKTRSDFDDVVKDNGPAIFRMCKAYLGTSDEVDDLYQEVLINVWRALPGFKGNSKLSTWIYRITVNTALTYLRKKKRQDMKKSYIDGQHDLIYDESGYHEKVQTETKLNQMMKVIGQLEKDQRIIIGLYLEDLSYKEIAEVVGKDTNYIGVKINRIKEKLTKMMKS